MANSGPCEFRSHQYRNAFGGNDASCRVTINGRTHKLCTPCMNVAIALTAPGVTITIVKFTSRLEAGRVRYEEC
jgi:hypothetical protein